MTDNTQVQNVSPISNSTEAIFSASSLHALQNFAQAMASGVATVPKHLQGNPSDCMAICMQAAQWQMSPYAVAQKTFLVGGVLGYEAQLVTAIINTRGPLKDRLHYEWFGPWEKIIGKFEVKRGEKGEYRVPGWKFADEEGIGIRVWATLNGEDEPRELTLYMAQARVRNSTLWAEDPRQQLAYLASKRWSRLYCPEVILGIYTPDELEKSRSERDITPARQTAASLNNLINDIPEPKEEKAAEAPQLMSDQDVIEFDSLIWQMSECQSEIELKDVSDKVLAIGLDEQSTIAARSAFKAARERINENK